MIETRYSVYQMDGDRKVHHLGRVEDFGRAQAFVRGLPTGVQWAIEKQETRYLFLGSPLSTEDTIVKSGRS